MLNSVILLIMTDLELKELRKELGLTQANMASLVGVDIKTIQNWERGRTIPKSKEGILRNLKTNQRIAFGVQHDQNDGDANVSENNGMHRIPFYDAETTGGYNDKVSSSNTDVSLKGYINAGDWFDGRETAAIRHVGDSMVEYPNGCILAVRQVLKLNLLVPGRNYVIETDEYRVTKRVQHGSSRETLALYSTNKEKYDDGRLIYEPFEVELSEIRRVFSVLGYIVSQSGESRLIKI